MNVRRLLVEKSVLVTGAAVVVAAIGLAALAAFWPSEKGEAGPAILVFEDARGGGGTTTEFDDADRAIAFASEKAGFEFRAPSAVPAGFALIQATIPPPSPVNPDLGPKRVTLRYARGDASFTVMVVNEAFQFEGRDEDHRLPSDAGELYRLNMDVGTMYTLFTDDHGYQLSVGKTPPFDEAAATAMLESFVR